MSKRPSKRTKTTIKKRKLVEAQTDFLKGTILEEIKKQVDLLEDDDVKRKVCAISTALLVERRTPAGNLNPFTDNEKDAFTGEWDTEEKIIGFKITRDGKLTLGKVNEKGQLEPEIDKMMECVLHSLLMLAKLQK